MPQIFVNNCYGTLAEAVNTTSTTLEIGSTEGLPVLAEGDWFLVTLFTDDSRYGSDLEVVKVTAIAANQMTIERGVEGNAYSHPAGAKFEARLTAGTVNTIAELAAKPSWELGDIRTSMVPPGAGWVEANGDFLPVETPRAQKLLSNPIFSKPYQQFSLSDMPFRADSRFMGTKDGYILTFGTRATAVFDYTGALLHSNDLSVTHPDAWNGSTPKYPTQLGDNEVLIEYPSDGWIAFASDGSSRYLADLPNGEPPSDVANFGDRLVAISTFHDTVPYYSTDGGATWQTGTVAGTSFNLSPDPVDYIAHGGSYYVLSRYHNGSSGYYILKSADGIHWESAWGDEGHPSSVRAVIEVAGKVYAVGNDRSAALVESAVVNARPFDWNAIGSTSNMFVTLDGVTYIFGYRTPVFRITEALDFEPLGGEPMDPDSFWVTASGVVVTAELNGTISLHSSFPTYDGDGPEPFRPTYDHPTPFSTTAKLWAVADNGDLLVIARGEDMYVSKDGGLSWTLRTDLSSSSSHPMKDYIVTHLAYSKGQGVAVMAQVAPNEPVFIYSDDDLQTLSPLFPEEVARQNVYEMAFHNGIFYAAMEDGRLAYSTDLTTLQNYPPMPGYETSNVYTLRISEAGAVAVSFQDGLLAVSTTLGEYLATTYEVRTHYRDYGWLGEVLYAQDYTRDEAGNFTYYLFKIVPDSPREDITDSIGLPEGSEPRGLDIVKGVLRLEVRDADGEWHYYTTTDAITWEGPFAGNPPSARLSSPNFPDREYTTDGYYYMKTPPYYDARAILRLPTIPQTAGIPSYIYLGE